MPRAFTEAQAEAMVTIVFSAGAEALDVGVEQRRQLEERLYRNRGNDFERLITGTAVNKRKPQLFREM